MASISERLAQLQAKKSPKRVLMPDRFLSISDEVMQIELYKRGYTSYEINRILLNVPVEDRERILNEHDNKQ